MTSGGRTSKSGHVTNISMGLPVTSLTNTRAGPAAGGAGRFGGVAAAMATRGGAAALRGSVFWGVLFFLGSLPF